MNPGDQIALANAARAVGEEYGDAAQREFEAKDYSASNLHAEIAKAFMQLSIEIAKLP